MTAPNFAHLEPLSNFLAMEVFSRANELEAEGREVMRSLLKVLWQALKQKHCG